MSYINEEEIMQVIKKIEFYTKEEKMIFSSINEIFKNTDFCYSSSNNSKIYNQKTALLSKINTISKLHDDYIDVYRKNLEKYIEISRESGNKLDLIG